MILQKYADDHHFFNTRFFVDDGVSGVSFEREGLQTMLREVEAGNVATVITKDLSRLGRNEFTPLRNWFNDQYCWQVFDYKRRNGQYIGSFAPYGYLKDPKDKHQLIVDPDAAEIVKLIYDLCLQGMARRAMVYYYSRIRTWEIWLC